MMVLWLLGGIVVVTVAFFLPGQYAELWSQINSAGLAGALYVLALVAYTTRTPFPKKQRVVAWICTAVLGGAIVVWWTGMDSTSHWQRDRLHEIRVVTSRGVIQGVVPRTLIQSLELYHKQGSKKKETLGQIFRKLNPQALPGSNIHVATFPNDSLSVVVQVLENDRVTLVAHEAYVPGRKAEFINIDGRLGRVQERFTLTEKGVSHESEN
ncbi:MAG: hypothetical protein WBD36_11755 [Bacteroidota bacterium]